jgi:hypothetical protein
MKRILGIVAVSLALLGCGGGLPHVTLCSSDSDCAGGLKCVKSIQSTECDSVNGCACDIVQYICTHPCTTSADCGDVLFGNNPATCEAATDCPGPNNLCN